MINILGDSQRKSRYNPNLAEQVNRQIELEEKREALKRKSEPKPEVQEPEIQTHETSEPTEQRKDYVFVPALGLYLSENRYHQNKTWDTTQEILHKEGKRMPNIPEFIEFLKYLRSAEGKKNVKNAEKILDEVYTVREPWRAEWLDAKFEDGNVNYHIFDSKGKIVQRSEKLEAYLAEDKTPGIDLDSWLKNPTKQGLPKPNCKDGSLYYWYPRENSVARFDAFSVRAYLSCGYPASQDAGLGVRYVERPAGREDASKNARISILNSGFTELPAEK